MATAIETAHRGVVIIASQSEAQLIRDLVGDILDNAAADSLWLALTGIPALDGKKQGAIPATEPESMAESYGELRAFRMVPYKPDKFPPLTQVIRAEGRDLGAAAR